MINERRSPLDCAMAATQMAIIVLPVPISAFRMAAGASFASKCVAAACTASS